MTLEKVQIPYEMVPEESYPADEAYWLEINLEKKQRYHSYRRAWYEFLHRLTMFGVLVSGSAAFARVFPNFEWDIFGAIAAGLAAIDMVLGFSLKARDHEMLCRRFGMLGVQLHAKPANQATIRRWRATIAEISVDEPPSFRALEAICHNETVISRNLEPEFLIDLGFIHRALHNFVKFRDFKIRMRWQVQEDNDLKSRKENLTA